MMSLKDILDESIVLAQVQTSAFRRHHAGRVLTAVLQDGQAVKEQLVDLCVCVCDARSSVEKMQRLIGMLVFYTRVIFFLDA
jgi:soluble P-type ATPase